MLSHDECNTKRVLIGGGKEETIGVDKLGTV